MKYLLKIQEMIILIVVMCTTLTAYAAQAELQYSVGMGVEFASGKYGTDTRTESLCLPVTAAFYPTKRFNLLLDIPYIYQSSTAVNSSVMRGPQGQVMSMRNVSSGAASGSGSGMGPGMGGSMTTATAGNMHNEQTGFGDVTVKAGYVLIPEGEVIPQVRPNFFVKFPTADKDKALGTGEMDAGFAVELSKWLGDWLTFAEAGYAIQDKSPLLSLKNYLYYRAAVGYQVTDKLRPTVMLRGSSSPAEGASDLLEARLRLKYQLTIRAGLEGYLAKGLTTNSPDYGAGLTVYIDF